MTRITSRLSLARQSIFSLSEFQWWKCDRAQSRSIQKYEIYDIMSAEYYKRGHISPIIPSSRAEVRRVRVLPAAGVV